MAPLSAASAKAIDRLREYVPPPTSYSSLPLSRQAAVLILLFADRRGDLRVVLTLRANTLKSYPGQSALPGGKADSLSETPFETARREAFEEIGLPNKDSELPRPFRVEHLCELPTNLAKTELVVRPCVALLHAYDEATGKSADPEVSLIPRLDAKEVAAVFTAPFHNFLKERDEPRGEGDKDLPGSPSDWYEGTWTQWHESMWRSCGVGSGCLELSSLYGLTSDQLTLIVHHFFVPITNQPVSKPRQKKTQAQENTVDQLQEEGNSGTLKRYRVFGMTARILVDAARVAYGQEPEFEHNSHFGDEDMIQRLKSIGRLSPIRKPGDELTADIMQKASSTKL